MDLQKIRKDIDSIDKKIVDLLQQRMEIVEDVADFKVQTKKPVLDIKREREKIASLKSLASNEFNRQSIEELFKQIMSMSRKLQYARIPQEENEPIFHEIEGLNLSSKTKVVYFGEKGSYSEQAMEECFGNNIISMQESSFKSIMDIIREGKADYGVLPIENTSTGGIGDIYDLLVQFDNYIIKEHIVKIEHSLLGLEEASLSHIKKVYSHPQGLQQSSKFLEEHKDMNQIQCFSTSYGAKKVLEDQDISQGAIAGKHAAKHYNLKVLVHKVNNLDNNSTRFIIISNKKEYIKNANKISICFELPHESGSLYDMLSHIIYNNLNMTNIESRPLENRNFEYRFFIDFEGNLKDSGVRNAMKGIMEEANNFKILGNF
jgi:chorismate mutase / prephenate dehydratase